MELFNEAQFRAKVDRALVRVKTLLDNSKNPQYPTEVAHKYDDKYLLVDSVTNAAIRAQLVSLEQLGLTAEQLGQMRDWAASRAVSLRFKSDERCAFVRKTVREVQSDTKSVSNSTLFGKSEHYTVTKVTEWFWNFEVSYQLTAYMGNDPSKPLVLQKRTGSIELKTTTETTPKPAASTRSFDVNITWLVTHADKTGAGSFRIDRAAASCRTPRRNADVQAAQEQLQQLYTFTQQVHRYITAELFPTQADHGLDLKALNDDSALFVPVLPLFEQTSASTADGSVIPDWLTGAYFGEQRRALAEKQKELAAAFPANDKLVTVAEARVVLALQHIRATCQMWADAVDFVELMLHRQLVAAIGKEVSQADLAQFLRFHYRKLFRPHVQPQPFSYAIRRAGHDPEGTLSLEAQLLGDASLSDPVVTMVSEVSSGRAMRFAIDAATEVRFGGERFVHGWVSHQFSGQASAALQLVARARQFSSYVVLVGSIAAADLFVPKYAMLVQNKDELRLPLLLETIPTPKAFRDAIESLSPEQQRFAKAFRSMQLESTLFGVCVLQIKPALERLLNLPPDSLTKELQLGQDLLQLFIEYQIPSDLLSYDGIEAAAISAKVAAVKANVNRVQSMVNAERERQLAEARLQQEMRLAEERARRQAEEERRRAEEERRRVEEERRREERSRREMEVERKVIRQEFGDLQSLRRNEQNTSLSGGSSGGLPRTTNASNAYASDARAPVPRPPQEGRASGAGAAVITPHAPVKAPPPVKSAAIMPSGGKNGQQPPALQNASPQPPTAQQPQPHEPSSTAVSTSSSSSSTVEIDFTKIPQELEQKYDQLDTDAALRPTIIKPAKIWTRKSKKSLLSEPESTSLNKDKQRAERQKCFDLLDALTKSGALQLEHAALHVVIAATHCFDKSVMNTLVQDNVNPVEKLERSALILASTVHRDSVARLVAPDQVQRVATYSPQLIAQEEIQQALASEQPVPSIAGK